MVKKNGETEILRCSFCNKDQNDVRKLIAGPTVFICDECVEVCNDIIADDNRFENRGVRSSLRFRPCNGDAVSRDYPSTPIGAGATGGCLGSPAAAFLARLGRRTAWGRLYEQCLERWPSC